MEIDDYIVATDARLVELASEGDQQAFEHLFTRYREALTRLFEQRLDDKAIASDLLQETFIKVYLHLDSYSKSYTFGQWIYAIARNTWLTTCAAVPTTYPSTSASARHRQRHQRLRSRS